MITLLVASRIETDDPDMIPTSLQYAAAVEALIEAFIVTVLMF